MAPPGSAARESNHDFIACELGKVPPCGVPDLTITSGSVNLGIELAKDCAQSASFDHQRSRVPVSWWDDMGGECRVSQLKCDRGGGPRVNARLLGSGLALVDGQKSAIDSRGRDGWIVKQADAFCGEEFVLERGLLDAWSVAAKRRPA